MRVFKPPCRIVKDKFPSIFLAGTIDMGNSVDWQEETIRHFSDSSFDIYNPRRDDWDAGWVQKIDNPVFAEQVNWELAAMESADTIVMNFLPHSQSPVTLLELGLQAGSKKLLVCCPDEYRRSGNVGLVCARYAIPLFKTMPLLLAGISIK